MRTLGINVVDTGTSTFRFQVPFKLAAHGILRVILPPRLDGLRHKRFSDNIIASLRFGNMYPIDDGVYFGAFEFILHTVCQQLVASGHFNIVHPFVRIARDMNGGNVLVRYDLVHNCSHRGSKVLETHHVNLVEYNKSGFVCEQWLD